jgi:hypothetical protein
VSEPSVITATSEAVLIAWDMGQGPTYKADAPERVHALYRVYRNGLPIGDTAAEVFYDQIVYDGSVYKYEVFVVDGDSETPVGPVFTAHVPRRRIGKATTLEDRVAPTAPSHFACSVVVTEDGREGIRFTWTPSSDSGSGICAYFVEANNGSQPEAALWNPGGERTEWTEPVPASVARPYRLRALDGKLNLSEPSNIAKLEGWTIYTFRSSSAFRLKTRKRLTADVLRVGAGGSGGAGNQQGAGGGGGWVIDEHGFEVIAGETDGDVTVGEGREVAAAEALASLAGYNGGDSSFGGKTALGGGYGSGEGQNNYPAAGGEFYYTGADGGSGGGGGPWDGGILEGTTHYYGHGGAAIGDEYSSNTRIPYAPEPYTDVVAEREAEAPYGQSGYWEDDAGAKFWKVTRSGGHAGHDGWGYTAWYNITAGGGGGAHEERFGEAPWFAYTQFGEMQSGGPEHGGHGVPCDIAGYGPLWEESNHLLRIIPWYGGGGAGAERRVWWGYASGRPGYGGGGEVNEPGEDGTGGGGGGATTGANYPLPADTPGPKGGDGVVIIRISTADESKVAYPVIVDYENVYDPISDTTTLQPVYSDGVVVTRVGLDQPHTDISGDEQCPRTYEETHT